MNEQAAPSLIPSFETAQKALNSRRAMYEAAFVGRTREKLADFEYFLIGFQFFISLQLSLPIKFDK